MNNKVYISGPITNLDLDQSRISFKKAEKYLKSKGYETVNPFDNGVDENAAWNEHMRVDLRNMLECDSIYVLNGHESSRGCRLELYVALQCGLILLNSKVS